MKNALILIVDDEELVTRSLENLLKLETEYRIITFNDPVAALEELEKLDDISLIISDVIMPEMDGLEFLSKAKEIFPTVPRVILTGYADKENTIRAINEVGIFYYIEKPWNNDDLLLVIKNGIEKHDLVINLERKVDELESKNHELLSARNELQRQEKLSLVGKMTSSILHDLKNPMTTIRGLADIIKGNLSSMKMNNNICQSVIKSTQIILHEIERSFGMISETLSFIKGEEKLNLQNVSLSEVIDEALSVLSPIAEDIGINIALNCDEDIKIKLDKNKIHRVVYNLIYNSFDALPDGGSIRINIQKENDYVVLSISDNGIGIPENIKDRIFEPFFTYNKSDGTGLGLTIARKVLELHNAKIELYNNSDKGTTTLIKFPVD